MIPEDASISRFESVKRIRCILRRECRAFRKSFIIMKLPRLFSHIPVLTEAYPCAKFIHIIRDGRAVAMSVRFKFMRYAETEEEGLLCSAKYWVRAVKSVTEQEDRINIMELKYETFCADVHGYISSMLSFIGLDIAKFPFYRCPPKLVPTNHNWLRDIKHQEMKIVQGVEKDYLAKYGYI